MSEIEFNLQSACFVNPAGLDSMNKAAFLFLTIISSFSSIAQNEQIEWKEPSKESQAYREKREEISEPPFGLHKVTSLISKAKLNGDDNEPLDLKTYQSLSFREKFTYNMIHAESYSQICDAQPPIQDEQKKIFGWLPELFGENEWGERQIKFFISSKNMDHVMSLMKTCIGKDKKVGLNFKHAIIEMNAKEMISFLVKFYNVDRKDHDILTVLMILMEKNEYGPFMESTSYKKLYGNNSIYYESYLVLNKENQDLIIKRATDFYNGLSK